MLIPGVLERCFLFVLPWVIIGGITEPGVVTTVIASGITKGGRILL